MPMTIPQYAKDRHVSDKGVYKALERHPEIKELIYTGKSNGKDAKMLPDEAMGMLDQVMRHPYQVVDDTSKELQIFHNQEIEKKRDEIDQLKTQLVQEMGETRKEMIAAVGSAVSESVSANNEAIKTSIDELKDNQATAVKVATLQKDVDRLQEEVKRLEGEKQELREQIQKLEAELKAEHDKSIMQRIFKKG